jgi:hypothetical protein
VAQFGNTEIGARFQSKSFLARYSPNGELVWVKQLGSTLGDIAIDVDSNNEIVVTGNSSGDIAGQTGSGVFLARYNHLGNMLWARIYPAGSTDGGSSVRVLKDGTLLVAGTYQDPLTFGSITLPGENRQLRGFGAKFTSDGTPLWAKALGGRAYTVDAAADGTAWFGGFFSTNAPAIDGKTPPVVRVNDGFIVGIAPNGSVDQVVTLGSAFPDIVRDLHLHSDGMIYATGEANGPAFDLPTWEGAVFIARFSPVTAPQGAKLNVERNGNALVISWAPEESGFVVEAATSLNGQFTTPTNLQPVPGRTNAYSLPLSEGTLFLRLRK